MGLYASLYPKDPGVADPSDYIFPNEDPGSADSCECQTVEYQIGPLSRKQANNLNKNSNVMDAIGATGMGMVAGLLTRNHKVSASVSAGMGVWMAANSNSYQVGDTLKVTIEVCNSDTDTGVTVKSTNVRVIPGFN